MKNFSKRIDAMVHFSVDDEINQAWEEYEYEKLDEEQKALAKIRKSYELGDMDWDDHYSLMNQDDADVWRELPYVKDFRGLGGYSWGRLLHDHPEYVKWCDKYNGWGKMSRDTGWGYGWDQVLWGKQVPGAVEQFMKHKRAWELISNWKYILIYHPELCDCCEKVKGFDGFRTIEWAQLFRDVGTGQWNLFNKDADKDIKEALPKSIKIWNEKFSRHFLEHCKIEAKYKDFLDYCGRGLIGKGYSALMFCNIPDLPEGIQDIIQKSGKYEVGEYIGDNPEWEGKDVYFLKGFQEEYAKLLS